AADPGLAEADRAVIGLDLDQQRTAPRLHPRGARIRRGAPGRQGERAGVGELHRKPPHPPSPAARRPGSASAGGASAPRAWGAAGCRAGGECGSGNISTQYLFMIGRRARSVIHTFIFIMSSVVPPAVSITRRTLANIAAHCASRSAGTAPVAGSAPEIAPDTT